MQWLEAAATATQQETQQLVNCAQYRVANPASAHIIDVMLGKLPGASCQVDAHKEEVMHICRLVTHLWNIIFVALGSTTMALATEHTSASASEAMAGPVPPCLLAKASVASRTMLAPVVRPKYLSYTFGQ